MHKTNICLTYKLVFFRNFKNSFNFKAYTDIKRYTASFIFKNSFVSFAFRKEF